MATTAPPLAAGRRFDPTRTLGIRGQYERDMARRFRALRVQVRAAIVGQDVFGLAGTTSIPAVPLQVARAAEGTLARYGLAPFVPQQSIFQQLPADLRARVPIRRFDFPLLEDKIDGFVDWLDESADAMILEVIRGPAGRVTLRSGWQDLYVRSSYARGVDLANTRLRQQGVTVEELPEELLADVFNRPVHVQALGSLSSRSFHELQGVTRAMSQEMSRALADSFAQGHGARKMAGLLAGRVDKIGITRARMIARTETIRAFSDATLNRYSESGIRGVVGEAELQSAQDGKVCPICQGLEALGAIPIEEARGVIPVHPNCRCAWLPVVDFS